MTTQGKNNTFLYYITLKTNKISDDIATEADFTSHCNQIMRITILEVEVEEKFSINTESTEWAVIETLKVYFLKTVGSPELGETFEISYKGLLEEIGELTDLHRMQSLRKNIKSCLESILTKDDDLETPLQLATDIIDRILHAAKTRFYSSKNEGPTLPGSDPHF